MSAVLSMVDRRVNDRRVNVQDILNAADRRHRERRQFDQPTSSLQPNGLTLIVSDRPEKDSAVRFIAYYAGREATYGLGSCESEAVEDMHSMVAGHLEMLAERAAR